ncbi:MAG: hypothetical protein C0594_02385 [Marinilabiliales bacterium]|nr:MAG: hypothetical protein C0594_02385 [Marinilabiliales bacterium]
MSGNVLCAAAAFAAFCQRTKGSHATSLRLSYEVPNFYFALNIPLYFNGLFRVEKLHKYYLPLA